MMLSDRDIREARHNGDIGIEPFLDGLVQPASYDLRLDTTETGVPFLVPGEFVLASTIEVIKFGREHSGQLSGKSTWARRGLIVEAAGFFDPGFEGTATLEMHNMGQHPIQLPVGDPICQMVFFQLSSPAMRVYGDKELGSKYHGQRGVTPAR
jgi:dCTP deaminase